MNTLVVTKPPVARVEGEPDSYVAEVSDAPSWASAVETYSNGSVENSALPADRRTFTRVIDEFEWDANECVDREMVGKFFDEQFASVALNLIEETPDCNEQIGLTAGPFIELEVDWRGVYLSNPAVARRLAQALVVAADLLEEVQQRDGE